jgi:hypothetical protein
MTASGHPVQERHCPVLAAQRPICFSNPAVQRDEAGAAGIRQISTLPVVNVRFVVAKK